MSMKHLLLVSQLAVTVAAFLSFPSLPSFNLHRLNFLDKGNGKQIPFYYPEDGIAVIRDIFDNTRTRDLSLDESIDFAKSYIASQVGLKSADMVVSSWHKSNDGVLHVYLTRKVGVNIVVNHNAAVHLLNGQIIAESTSFSKASLLALKIMQITPKVSLSRAMKLAKAQFGLPVDNTTTSNAYVEIPGSKLVYAHVFQLFDASKGEWMQIFADTQTGQVVHAIDYVNDAEYQVIKLPNKSPLDGFENAVDPENPNSSPNGWTFASLTTGNNVDSAINQKLRVDGGSPKKVFKTDYVVNSEPTTAEGQAAAIINAFYLANMMHDIMYQFGFDETSGNFQENNFGKGGKGGDSVLINNQANGRNNANFATPPDGQKPVMNLYLFDLTNPYRDSSLDNTIPIHEYTHGVSNRLTGGPSNTNCLGTLEAGGLGEGWSDAVAVYLTMKNTDTRNSNFGIGSYSLSNSNGIRQFPYSTNMTTNPLIYSRFVGEKSVHAIGTIWATMLYELFWNLVDKYGFSADWMNAKQLKGNIIAMQLIIGAMKIQPCSPTLVSARDAILSADKTYYAKANTCLIWRAFSKRGLGDNAKKGKDDFNLPKACRTASFTADNRVDLKTESTSSATVKSLLAFYLSLLVGLIQ